MPVYSDIPAVIGFDDLPEESSSPRRGFSFAEFLKAPFRDLDGRASWRANRRRSSDSGSVKPYALA